MIIEIIQQNVLPAAGCAALVVLLFLTFGRWTAALGSAVAVVFAFIVANFSLENSVDSVTKLRDWQNASRLYPWKVESAPRLEWLPRAALVLVIVGLTSRWIGLLANRYLPERRWWVANLLVWLPRIVAVVIVSGWLISAHIAAELPWLRYEVLLAMLLSWLTLDGLARNREGCEVAAYLAASFYAASAILIYAHSKQYMELAVVLGSAMAGIAVASNILRTDVSGAVPAGVAFLPGLVLAAKPNFYTEIPAICFWLVPFAPLVLAPFLIPFLARKNGWVLRILRIAMLLIPLAIAVALAMKYGELAQVDE
jgi:hypothetical protein